MALKTRFFKSRACGKEKGYTQIDMKIRQRGSQINLLNKGISHRWILVLNLNANGFVLKADLHQQTPNQL